MSPAVVVALGTMAGISLASLIDLPYLALWAIFMFMCSAALIRTIAQPSGGQTLTIFIIFVLLGCLLLKMSPGKYESHRAETHTNPFYKSIAKLSGKALNEKNNSLMLAIVFGDQKNVDPVEKDNFRRAGLLHMFAASGFNVALLAGFIMILARYANAPKTASAALALISVIFYLWLVGSSPSVARAVVMSIILYLAIFFGRRVDALASTSIAAVILLAIDPRALFDIGWQLSFASLFGLLVLAPLIAKLFENERSKVVSAFSLTLGAQIAVAPFLINYFGQLSTLSVLANPMASGVVAYVTVVGFLAAFMSTFWPTLAGYIFATLSPPLAFVSWTSSVFANIPASTIDMQASLAYAVLFLILTLMVFAAFRSLKRRLTISAIIIFIIAAQTAGLWINLAQGIQREALSMHFLDIGQGDATLIKSEDGSVILIDGGRDFLLLDRELRQRRVNHLDLVIISHAHADHLGSVSELVKKYPVAAVIEPGIKYDSDAYRDFRQALAVNNIPRLIGRMHQKYQVGEIEIKILWPGKDLIIGSNSDVNNNSIVARIEYKKFSLLLTGDIEEEAIGELSESSVDLKSQVLKVSHQGSANGTTIDLLKKVQPKYAIISVGRNNPFGHPHQITLRRLNKFTLKTLRTDQDGDIYIGTDGKSIEMVSDK